ncbi:hypothetical protein CCZ01_04415 [Helicobacter monodelphidis]|uniref:TorD/DmsD family molecular chaperone n=1 Tax=Helicobacter sp. 15-1451 TaxID=2004995 RepID=UPI000DCF17CB|nr:molecular chaperone TorD family protein [Helicobacter sp. 15-1451]RAX57878.1 hypothetical protein CCZ01_04415 [Helicobacter sp. 15-1451]
MKQLRQMQFQDNNLGNIDISRCLYYDFFSRLFLYDLLDESYNQFTSILELMVQAPLDEDLSESYTCLLTFLQQKSLSEFKQEYTDLFILSPHSKQVHLILSHYAEGNVAGSILLDIRQFFRKLPVRMNTDFCKESEEHFGFLMLLMGYIIAHKDEIEESLQVELFSSFIAPFGFEIAHSLQQSEHSFYMNLGKILEVFIAFEEDFLKLKL